MSFGKKPCTTQDEMTDQEVAEAQPDEKSLTQELNLLQNNDIIEELLLLFENGSVERSVAIVRSDSAGAAVDAISHVIDTTTDVVRIPTHAISAPTHAVDVPTSAVDGVADDGISTRGVDVIPSPGVNTSATATTVEPKTPATILDTLVVDGFALILDVAAPIADMGAPNIKDYTFIESDSPDDEEGWTYPLHSSGETEMKPCREKGSEAVCALF
ncbi:hypothetical protein EIP86_010979 [Pleurotus ostreatoroseus]|nr:hypothetical protein EIP86_010979 [Pleurotus ostreatoroseus]